MYHPLQSCSQPLSMSLTHLLFPSHLISSHLISSPPSHSARQHVPVVPGGCHEDALLRQSHALPALPQRQAHTASRARGEGGRERCVRVACVPIPITIIASHRIALHHRMSCRRSHRICTHANRFYPTPSRRLTSPIPPTLTHLSPPFSPPSLRPLSPISSLSSPLRPLPTSPASSAPTLTPTLTHSHCHSHSQSLSPISLSPISPSLSKLRPLPISPV